MIVLSVGVVRMLGEMKMSELGAKHAEVHAKHGFGYQPAAPNDPWFAIQDQPGACHGGWYQAYLKAYRATCGQLGIALGAIADRAYPRFGVVPNYA
jgi:hypothetical protein